jgi:hypothetical protein
MRRSFRHKAEVQAIYKLPEEVLMGWLAHELGHIMDYLERSNLGMLGFGIAYISSHDTLRKAERRADAFAVRQGMGEYLIETRRFILRSTGMPKRYVQRIGDYYHGPKEIELLMADED